jgi:hypothetical protein
LNAAISWRVTPVIAFGAGGGAGVGVDGDVTTVTPAGWFGPPHDASNNKDNPTANEELARTRPPTLLIEFPAFVIRY